MPSNAPTTTALDSSTTPSAPAFLSGNAAVAVSALGFGLSPVFATRAFAAGVDPIAASFIRVAVLALITMPMIRTLRGWGRTGLVVMAGGAVSMLGFAGFFVALERAPVGAATVVYYTYPVVVVLLSALVWKTRLRGRDAAICGSVLVGVGLAVGPIGMSADLIVSLAPAFAAPIGWSVFLLILSGPAAEMPLLPKMLAGWIGGSLALLPITLARTGVHVMPFDADAIVAVSLLTLCTLAIPAVLVTWGAARSGERATAMIGSLEFVVAVAAGWLILDDDLTRIQVAGVLLVLAAAIAASRLDRTRRPSQREAAHPVAAGGGV